jgi:hypothetical protein
MVTITIPPHTLANGAPMLDTSGNPVPGFTGRRAGVMFDNGVGYTPELNSQQRFNFSRWGYTIEGDEGAPKASPRKRKGSDDGKEE